MKKSDRKLLTALICYGVLILVALLTLLPARSSNDSFILLVVLLVFTLLIVKTIAHSEDEP
jgi:hypothetical protein